MEPRRLREKMGGEHFTDALRRRDTTPAPLSAYLVDSAQREPTATM